MAESINVGILLKSIEQVEVSLVSRDTIGLSMGAAWSVSFVGSDAEEVFIPIDVLSAASTVWRERLKLAGQYDEKCRSEEACETNDVKAFVKMISHGSQDTASVTDVDLTTMYRSLNLVHKYDCKGTVKVLSALEASHFPKLTAADFASGKVTNGAKSFSHEGVTGAPSRRFCVSPPWLTQTHLDYIVLKQELFGVGSLNVTMKQILVHALSARIIKEDNGTNENTNKVFVDMKEVKTKDSKAWMRLAAWRLANETLLDLFARCQPVTPS